MELLNHIFEDSEDISLQGKTAVITGASSGIGLATAAWLAREGVHLILIARRIEKLEQLKKELNDLFPTVKIKTLQVDLESHDFLKTLEKENVFNTDIFINNAGLALTREHMNTINESDIDAMINTNVTALFKLTAAVSKKMIENAKGHIINIASIAGHYSYAGGAVYCATKSAVRAFSTALRQELNENNVRVSVISPGMVQTDFSLVRFKGDKAAAEKVYEGVDCLQAKDIARVILKTLKEPQHVNLDEIVILPTVQAPVSLKVFRS